MKEGYDRGERQCHIVDPKHRPDACGNSPKPAFVPTAPR